MGKILGGSSTQSTQIPAWLEAAGQSAVGRAGEASQIGYVPWTGPDVAAMSGGQVAAMQGNNQALDAFGLPTSQSTMPQAQDFGGISGYSSNPMYQQAIAQMDPSQRAQIEAMFGGRAQAAQSQLQAPAGSSGRNEDPFAPVRVPQGGAGYTGLLDMVNGGGAGASGDRFQGGGILSDYGNWRTKPLGGN